ncbi:hypothetical protein PTKIN_Ptkin09bG0077800 [Pterospermum kingtungense]
MEEEKGDRLEGAIFRDSRRYLCQYCGICRSKKSLIISHILTHHPEETVNGGKEEEEIPSSKSNTCEECGAVFKKPAHLKQHLQSHSLERPFVCVVDDCRASYRRKDHLNRHLLQHQGKLFKCPNENCNREFAFQGNMNRHVKEFHDNDLTFSDDASHEQHVCQEVGCGKVFKFASRLRKHEDSHVKLDSVEAFCSEPSCLKYFTNEQCLKAHVQSCHRYIDCEICGTKYLKKNIKRHLRSHESGVVSERIKCSFEGCAHTFTTKSNLRQHIKALHEELHPFACSFSGCGMRFSYKHVRDKHEKSGLHIYVPGDFIESDEQFRSRPRGGRKRTCPTVDMITRKRVTPLQMDAMRDPEPTSDCS